MQHDLLASLDIVFEIASSLVSQFNNVHISLIFSFMFFASILSSTLILHNVIANLFIGYVFTTMLKLLHFPFVNNCLF
jgi:hypothetical protein